MNMQTTAQRKIKITQRLEKLFIFLTGMLLAAVLCIEFTYECGYGEPQLPSTQIAGGIALIVCGYAAYCYGTFTKRLSEQIASYRDDPSHQRKRAIGAMLHANLLRIVICK